MNEYQKHKLAYMQRLGWISAGSKILCGDTIVHLVNRKESNVPRYPGGVPPQALDAWLYPDHVYFTCRQLHRVDNPRYTGQLGLGWITPSQLYIASTAGISALARGLSIQPDLVINRIGASSGLTIFPCGSINTGLSSKPAHLRR